MVGKYLWFRQSFIYLYFIRLLQSSTRIFCRVNGSIGHSQVLKCLLARFCLKYLRRVKLREPNWETERYKEGRREAKKESKVLKQIKSKYYGFIHREVFHVPKSMLLVPKIYSPLPIYRLHVINNDTGEEIPQIFRSIEPYVYTPNKVWWIFLHYFTLYAFNIFIIICAIGWHSC